jgi:hypothetical protein
MGAASSLDCLFVIFNPVELSLPLRLVFGVHVFVKECKKPFIVLATASIEEFTEGFNSTTYRYTKDKECG